MCSYVWCLLGLLLLLLSAFGGIDAVDDDCNFQQKLEHGKSYVITHPNTTDGVPTSKSCQWHARSDTRVKLTCNDFNVAPSPKCESEYLQVYTDPVSGSYKFCGHEGFNIESEGKEMLIRSSIGNSDIGGSFSCIMQSLRQSQCDCGWHNPVRTRIVNGVETGVNEYPMMAAIVDSSIMQVWCGATIISSRHVLTAAHCLLSLRAHVAGVLVGEHDTSVATDTNAVKLFRVERYEINPFYSSTAKDDAAYKNDIAVVTVDGTIPFSREVGPACLPFSPDFNVEGANVDLLGWGSVENAGRLSNTLQKAEVFAINYWTCKPFYPEIDRSQMCTYGPGRDSCQFDSGGPVLWKNPFSGRLVLAGVISYGKNCGGSEPAVNTRVDAHLDWILQVTRGAEFCRVE